MLVHSGDIRIPKHGVRQYLCHDCHPDPIVVNLPELDKFAEPATREYPHP